MHIKVPDLKSNISWDLAQSEVGECAVHTRGCAERSAVGLRPQAPVSDAKRIPLSVSRPLFSSWDDSLPKLTYNHLGLSIQSNMGGGSAKTRHTNIEVVQLLWSKKTTAQNTRLPGMLSNSAHGFESTTSLRTDAA